LRQIDTRVIPCNSWRLCVSSFKQVNDHLRPRCGQGLQFIPSSLASGAV
jgi:hypothetical protein